MELRKINTDDMEAQWVYTTQLPADENGLTNPYHGVSLEDYKEKVLPTLMSYEHPVGMPDWFVPETYYYLWEGDCLIGEFRIRHHLTEALKAGCTYIWLPLDKALEIFGKYEEYHETDIADYGLYRREFLALTEVAKAMLYKKIM